MRTNNALYVGVAAVAIAMIWAGSVVTLGAQPAATAAVRLDSDDLGGVVTGPNGPEAGVWVIAETTELPTRYAKTVVTDDQGRYVVPDLPKAKYKVWVRGYGLVDSPKVDGEPGQHVNLRAVPAPNAAAVAQSYPAIYWYSMLRIPDESQFGGKSSIPAKITQSDWLTVVKNRSCIGCHQLGQLSTRTIPATLGEFKSGEEAWIRRAQSGQAGPLMLNPLTGVLGGVPFKYFGDWTDRIARGELPHSQPTRPQGVERNIVVTTWEWGDPKKYLHDLIASDRRYPTVNAYGPVYGSPEYATDDYPILDPKTHTVTTFRAPVRDADTPEALGPGHAAIAKPMAPSPYWGEEKIWDTKDPTTGLLQEGLGPSLGQAVPAGADEPLAHDARSEDEEVHVRRHLLPDPSPAVRLRRQRHAVDERRRPGGRLGQRQDVRRDGRRGQVAGMDGVHPRHQRQRQARRLRRARSAGRPNQGQAHRRGLLRRHAESGRRLDLGLRRGVCRHRGGRTPGPGAEPAGHRARRDLQRAEALLRHPRRRHRQAGRRVGVDGERPHRQLRPPQVQGPAQRAEGHRRSLPGGLGVLPVPRPRLPGHRGEQRRVELLHVGRPAQHVRARRGRANVHGQPQRRPGRPQRTAR